MRRARTLLLMVATAVATGCTAAPFHPPAPAPTPPLALHTDADQRVAEQALTTLDAPQPGPVPCVE